MNKMKLFEAIDLIDDDLIREAEISSETSTKRSKEDESAITVSGVEVRSGIRWQRIAALASAFILIAGFGGIGALLHKHRPTRHIEPSEVVIPPATESTTAAEDKQTESTEAAAKKEKDKVKETKESTNTAPTTEENEEKKPAAINSHADNDELPANVENNTPEEKPTEPVRTSLAATTKKPATTAKTTTTAKIQPVTNAPSLQDSVVRVTITEINGNTLLVKPVASSVELNSSSLFSLPTSNLASDIKAYIGMELDITYSGGILETYPAMFGNVKNVTIVSEAVTTPTEPWVIHLPCTKESDIAWRPYECPEMFDILRSIQYRQITAAEFAVTDYEAPNTYLIDSNDNNRVYALNFEHKWVMRYGTDGTDCGDAPMPDRLYELFCGS